MGYPDALTTTPVRSGMSCVICARISTAPLTRKWASWAISSGRAATRRMPIRGTRTPLKRSSIPQRSGAAFSPATAVAPIDKLTEEYPMVLSTVREVSAHYSRRSMTGNCAALAAPPMKSGLMRVRSPPTPRVWHFEDEALVYHSRKGKIITRVGQRSPKQSGRLLRPTSGGLAPVTSW